MIPSIFTETSVAWKENCVSHGLSVLSRSAPTIAAYPGGYTPGLVWETWTECI